MNTYSIFIDTYKCKMKIEKMRIERCGLSYMLLVRQCEVLNAEPK